MNLCVNGSRTFSDERLLYAVLTDYVSLVESKGSLVTILSGGCRGADLLAEQFAKEVYIPIRRFNAEWDLYGKAAGPIRNKKMIDHAHGLISFWDGQSRGTKHTIDYARKKGIPVKVIEYLSYERTS